MDDLEIRQRGFRLLKPGEQIQPDQTVINPEGQPDIRYVGPKSGLSERPPLATGTEPLSTGIPAYGKMLGGTSLAVGKYLATEGPGIAARSTLPTIGALGAGAISPLLAPVGAMAGMGANQAIGLEPNLRPMDYALGGALAGVPGAVGSFTRSMPGAEVAMQRTAQQELRALPGTVRRAAPALRPEMPQTLVPIPATTELAERLGQRASNVVPAWMTSEQTRALKGGQQLAEMAKPTAIKAEGISLEALDANRTQAGRLMRQARKAGTADEADITKFYATLAKDLDNAATRPGIDPDIGRQLADHADWYKRELASNRLATILDTGKGGTIRSKGGWDQQSFDAAVDKIRGDRELRSWLPPDVIEGTVKTLQEQARKIPPISSSARPGLSMQGFAARGMIGYPIGAGLQAMGLPTAAAVPAAVLSTEGIGHLLTTPAGQLVVRHLTKQGVPFRVISQLGLQMLDASLAR